MDPKEVIKIVRHIVQECVMLKNQYTEEKELPVDYVAIFSQNEEEYNNLRSAASKLGKEMQNTPTGPTFKVKPIKTDSGEIVLLKIQAPDPAHHERGGTDFRAKDYAAFKKKYIKNYPFILIKRPEYEMIELQDKNFDVITYFSSKSLTKDLGLDQEAESVTQPKLPGRSSTEKHAL